jgi:hypothetical protein
MKRFLTYISVALLALALGISVAWFVQNYRSQSSSAEVDCGSHSSCKYIFKPLNTPEIVIFHDSTSSEHTQFLFESNARGKLIERGEKRNEQGMRVGERGVAIMEGTEPMVVRIFWTDGAEFWAVQSTSLNLAREYERNLRGYLAAMSNNGMHPTAR